MCMIVCVSLYLYHYCITMQGGCQRIFAFTCVVLQFFFDVPGLRSLCVFVRRCRRSDCRRVQAFQAGALLLLPPSQPPPALSGRSRGLFRLFRAPCPLSMCCRYRLLARPVPTRIGVLCSALHSAPYIKLFRLHCSVLSALHPAGRVRLPSAPARRSWLASPG